jgi:hypothetical protein
LLFEVGTWLRLDGIYLACAGSNCETVNWLRTRREDCARKLFLNCSQKPEMSWREREVIANKSDSHHRERETNMTDRDDYNRPVETIIKGLHAVLEEHPPQWNEHYRTEIMDSLSTGKGLANKFGPTQGSATEAEQQLPKLVIEGEGVIVAPDMTGEEAGELVEDLVKDIVAEIMDFFGQGEGGSGQGGKKPSPINSISNDNAGSETAPKTQSENSVGRPVIDRPRPGFPVDHSNPVEHPRPSHPKPAPSGRDPMPRRPADRHDWWERH